MSSGMSVELLASGSSLLNDKHLEFIIRLQKLHNTVARDAQAPNVQTSTFSTQLMTLGM